MPKNVTAIYRSHAIAERVREHLLDIGVSSGAIHLIPDRDVSVPTGGTINDGSYMDRLHDLHLPEDDLRTYQHSVRRGDHVVSAEVEDSSVGRAVEVMRRPEEETYDLDRRALDFENEDLIAHSSGEGHMLNEERRARRIAGHDDRFSRIYERDVALDHPERLPPGQHRE